jgi:transcriptional regulator with XRE-family HTH domain
MKWNKTKSSIGLIRKSKGFTLQALADAAGVHITQIQRFESGERDIMSANFKTVIAIADALGVDSHELIKK